MPDRFWYKLSRIVFLRLASQPGKVWLVIFIGFPQSCTVAAQGYMANCQLGSSAILSFRKEMLLLLPCSSTASQSFQKYQYQYLSYNTRGINMVYKFPPRQIGRKGFHMTRHRIMKINVLPIPSRQLPSYRKLI